MNQIQGDVTSSSRPAAAAADTLRFDPHALELLIGRSRSLAAIAGLAIGWYAAARFGYEFSEAIMRGLVAGAASALAVWALALGFAAWLRGEALRALRGAQAGRRPGAAPEAEA